MYAIGLIDFASALPDVWDVQEGLKRHKRVIGYKIHTDSLKKRVVARLIVEQLWSKRSFLFIHERGIWSGSENPFIFDKLYECCTGTEIDPEKCLVFTEGEQELADAFVCLALFNAWGFVFAGTDHQSYVEVDHDDYISIYNESAEREADWQILERTAQRIEK